MTCSPQPTTLRRVCTFGATKDEQEKGLEGGGGGGGGGRVDFLQGPSAN